MSKIEIRQALTVLSFLGLVLFSCREPVEGCLDVEATNYNVAADDPCSDCCTYPAVSLSVSHSYTDSLRFSFDSTYTDVGGNIGRFEQVIFYLSDFKLINADNTDSLEVVETIELDLILGGTETFKDDYTLVTRSITSFDYEVGEIRGKGDFATLKFSVGLAGNAAFSNAETVTEGHSLALTTDTLWTFTEGYVFNRIIMIPDTTNAEDTRQFDIKNLTALSLPFQVEVNIGTNLEIPLTIDYKEWFSGIDFVSNTDDEIMDKIVENTANVFSITE